MGGMADDPDLLLRLSRIFGPEVENYRETGMPLNLVHPTVPEIFVVSNTPPASKAPPRLPDPPLTADGKLPVQFPHRRGWHTDQSYRRPPAGHLALPGGGACAAGPGPDALRRRDRGL